MKNIYIVRHGETFFNVLSRIQGWCDTPLTLKGKESARKLGTLFSNKDICFDIAFTSDLTRAVDTTKLILENGKYNSDIPMIETTNLREVSFGCFEGNNSSEVWRLAATNFDMPFSRSGYTDYEKIILLESIKKMDFFNFAEDLNDIKLRISSLLNQIATSSYNNILVVSHGLFISCLIFYLFKDKNVKRMSNSTVRKILFDGQNFKVNELDLHNQEDNY
ncbi:histidine phosphatase family protein [Sporolactobacillus spathodeae]|uniref:Phosphoglycerate mutase n=1 Tax=Sporolactobacillus spathodeae TaxID=1465502 RepID=A0ABS2Q7M6_9BACL|nr:histidine phosphatase family protein [Sporolactobacillus spathodeae]MBM7657748.1 putative phosphoglycerate mutase [Sporolactobacillus spathodeae]